MFSVFDLRKIVSSEINLNPSITPQIARKRRNISTSKSGHKMLFRPDDLTFFSILIGTWILVWPKPKKPHLKICDSIWTQIGGKAGPAGSGRRRGEQNRLINIFLEFLDYFDIFEVRNWNSRIGPELDGIWPSGPLVESVSTRYPTRYTWCGQTGKTRWKGDYILETFCERYFSTRISVFHQQLSAFDRIFSTQFSKDSVFPICPPFFKKNRGKISIVKIKI